MLLSTLLFASSSLAFLVPQIDNEWDSDFVPTFIDTNSQTVNIDCTSCPYALSSERNGAHEWMNNVDSSLEMKFESQGDALKLNDVPFYPITNPTPPPILHVKQSAKGEEASEGYQGNLRLSYSVEYDEKKFEDNTLVTILMTVMGLDGEMVRIDNVEITAIKDEDNKVPHSLPIAYSPKHTTNIVQLILHSVKTVPVSPDSPDAKCESIMCRVFSKLITVVAKAKSSAKAATHKVKCFCMKCFHILTGQKHHHAGASEHDGSAHGIPYRGPVGSSELPGHRVFNPHHGHHHHKGFVSQMAIGFKIMVRVVFVPILVGVALGVASSALGMLVGQFIVVLAKKFRRNDREATYEPLDIDDKDAPPAYQDLQGSEAINEKDVDAKA